MAKERTIFKCQECHYETSKWIGKCPDCLAWNTFQENISIEAKLNTNSKLFSKEKSIPKKISDINLLEYSRLKTGIKEFDRVMGGGITDSSITLLGGEPGIGKSTLIMEICGKLSKLYPNKKILYVSGEESESQVAKRSKRLNIESDNLYLYNETSWQSILHDIKDIKPSFFILDSIQTAFSSDIPSAAGTTSQVREVTFEIMNYAKSMGITCFIIGHITKDGSIAGPKILEHMVDTVVYFEGDQFGQYRLLRVIKNRFGNTNEVGIFEMTEKGLCEVNNPSQLFLDPGIKNAIGRSLTCIIEGSRSLFIEIQALVVENKHGNGRRITQGLDSNRLSLLVAIVDKYFEIPLSFNDIYVNVVGGIKLLTRESDLSILASLLSSYYSRPLDEEIIFMGEVGLTGEVRSVPFIEARLNEISQMNYKKIIASERIANEFNGRHQLKIIGIKSAFELKKLLFE